MNLNNGRAGEITRNKYHQFMKENEIDSCLTPITRISALINMRNQRYEPKRKQFPVRPAEAVSIHRSQGQTYSSVRADFTNKERYDSSLLYV